MEKLNYGNNLKQKSKVLSLLYAGMLTSFLSQQPIQAQSSVKELLTKKEFKKDISQEKEVEYIEFSNLLKTKNGDLLKFIDATKQKIYLCFDEKKERKKEENFVTLTYNGRLGKIYTKELEYVYNHIESLKDKIASIVCLDDAKDYRDLNDGYIEYKGKKIFISDLDHEGFLHMKDGNSYDGIDKLITFCKRLVGKEKAMLIFNQDYSIGSFYLINEEKLEHGENVLNQFLETAKKEIDSIDITKHIETGFQFETKEEEQLAKIYLYVVNNFEYCKSCLYEKDPKKWGNNGIEILGTHSGVCDGYAKSIVYLANEYGIDVKREVGYSSVFGGFPGAHAWNSYIINGKKYLFDATNEKIFCDDKQKKKMNKFGKTNLFKLPLELGKMMYSKDEKDINYEILEKYYTENKEKIDEMRKTTPNIIHNDMYLDNVRDQKNRRRYKFEDSKSIK